MLNINNLKCYLRKLHDTKFTRTLTVSERTTASIAVRRMTCWLWLLRTDDTAGVVGRGGGSFTTRPDRELAELFQIFQIEKLCKLLAFNI